MGNSGILHLCFDGNFINSCYNVFEKFFPNKNIFIVDCPKGNLEIVKQNKRVIPLSITRENYFSILTIFNNNNVGKIVIHGVASSYSGLLRYLEERGLVFKCYWIFWGYELYNALGQSGKIKLIDEKLNPFKFRTYIYPNRYNKILRILTRKPTAESNLLPLLKFADYFCFWNYADYELLMKYYNTNICFKYFAYSANYRSNNSTELFQHSVKNNKTILINHQASLTGNHYTVMKKIHLIDVNNEFLKVVPLSYGSKYIKKVVLGIGKKFFNEKFSPITKYLDKSDYFDLISKVEVAIFGANRQEASGNIHSLLKNGVKVFIRNHNNLLQYYRKKGYLIFSFDDELNSLADLMPLSVEEQMHNFNISKDTKIYYDDFMPTFFD